MFLIDQLILVVGVLLLLGIASNLVSSRLGIPVLVLFLFLGMLAGSEGIGGLNFDNYALAHGIGTLALAMILFDGGLSTPIESVRETWKPSVMLATVGVLITAVVTGVAASWILDIKLLEGLLLGSIVGSTDAAAVFSILRNGGVSLPKKISSTLEIESGSNDPMAIFMTIGCIEVISHKMDFGVELLGLFFSQMVVGVLAGIGIGSIAVWIVNRIQLGAAGLYPILVTAFCLLSFGAAANLGGSGFLAVYLAGIVLGNQKIVFQRGIRLYHDAIAWFCQIIMFIMLGLLSFPSRLLSIGWKALFITLVLILLARPLAVFFSLIPFRFRIRELLFMSWVGLKGAVPITLATFPLMLGTPHAPLLFDTIFFIVVISALVQGSSLPLVAKWLGLIVPAEPRPPVTLEISSLQHVEGDIVDFLISENSRAAGRMVKDLALPEGVVIALIARKNQLIPPQGRTQIEAGDHAIIVLRPEARPLVNQIFASTEDQRGILPNTLEFPLRASVTVQELHDLYGILIKADPQVTLNEAIRDKLGPAKTVVGAEVRFGPLLLRVRSLKSDGSIDMVGIVVLSELEIRYAEQIKTLS